MISKYNNTNLLFLQREQVKLDEDFNVIDVQEITDILPQTEVRFRNSII